MRPIARVGAVNYLNTKPLIECLSDFSDSIDLSLDLPSRLARQMEERQLDVGLIPVIEFFRAGTYTMLPGISIASRGPVLSVTLFSKVPWKQIRSVALDEGSRTSAALTRILLKKRYGAEARFEPLPIDANAESVATDAVLLIGDRAMRACLPGFAHAYDLGHEWTSWTGLPMVFAVWAVREGVDLGGSETAFQKAKHFGLSQVGLIAAREAPLLGLDPGYCRRYLEHIIHYDLGPAELGGLTRFYHLAVELGFAPEGVSLAHYNRPHLVESR